MTTNSIGLRIKSKRAAKGWSPFELSLAAKIPEQNIRLWEAGRTPSTEVIASLAKALGTSPNYLLTGKEKFA